MRRQLVVTAATAALALTALALPARAGPQTAADRGDLGRQVLGPTDGWAAYSTGTTGGSTASADQVHVASDRAELVEALGGDNESNGENNTPKIIYIDGTIRGNVDAQNNPLSCQDYAAAGYRLEAYLEQYDPDTWGEREPSGPLEEAREQSQENQEARVQINVGSNTTIVGLGDDARLVGVNLFLEDVDNVIIRNIAFENAHDCFPLWDPTDGDGAWNSEYDNLSLRGATHVWVDHNTFSDDGLPDSSLPEYFGALFQVHDGLLDITNGSDFVTLSYNVLRDHDKALLIGSTDDPTDDRGHLRVTIHHNRFDNLLQRAPRVRFGKVHVYNNHYIVPGGQGYHYSWGVGVESKTYAENNYFDMGEGIEPADILSDLRGTTLFATGTLVNGRSRHHRVDVVAAYNAAHDPDFGRDVGWEPTLHGRIGPTQRVPAIVRAKAGAGRACMAGARVLQPCP